MTDEQKLLADVKSTLDAMDALKSGKPTKKSEEVEEAAAEEVVEEVATEEVAAEETEKSEEVETTKEEAPAEEAAEATEEVVEEVVEEEVVEEKSATPQIVEAIAQLTKVVGGLAQDIEALKASKSTRKSVMPAEKQAEQVEVSKEAKTIAEMNYIFGGK